jgi:DnaJ-class molecular chaperone
MGIKVPRRSEALAILGLGENPTLDEINRARKVLLAKYHPDINNGEDVMYKKVEEAHWSLTKAPSTQSADSPPPDPFAEFEDGAVASDEGIKLSKPGDGKDIEIKIKIDSKLALFGGQKAISYSVGGARKSFKIKIPMGTSNGKKIRVVGKGHPGTFGGKAGDLYILVEIEVDSFKNDGDSFSWGDDFNDDIRIPISEDGEDFEISISIDANLASAGGQKAISYSINGAKRSFKVQIPPGTRNGQRIRVAGRGYPGAAGGVSGDLYVHVQVEESRRGEDIKVVHNIDYPLAIRGGQITIKYSANGQMITKQIQLKPGKTSTYLLTFAGEGGKGAGGAKNGDLNVHIVVAKPVRGRDINAYATVKASNALALMFSGKTSVPIRDFDTGTYIRNFDSLDRSHRDGVVYTFKGEGGKGERGFEDGDLNLHVHFTEGAKASKLLIPGIIAAAIVIGIAVNNNSSSDDYVIRDTIYNQNSDNQGSTDSSGDTGYTEDPGTSSDNNYDPYYEQSDPTVDEGATGGVGDGIDDSGNEIQPGDESTEDDGATGGIG